MDFGENYLKNPQCQNRKTSFVLLVRGLQETLLQNVGLCFILELERKMLLLKITHTSDTRLGRLKWELTGKPPP